jgi:Glycosyltransferase family 87
VRPRVWLGVVVAVHVIVVIAAMTNPANEDVPRYWAIASTPLRPYTDFPVEYPVLALALIRAIGSITHSMEGFGRILVTLNAAADSAIWVMVWRQWGRRAGLRYGVLIVPLLPLLLTRIDLLTVLAAVIALVALSRRCWPVMGAAVAVGVGIKFWPVLVGIAVVAATRGGDRARAAVWVLIGLAAFVVVSLAVGGRDGLEQVVTFRGAHHPEIESTVGAIGRLFAPGPAIEEAGAWRAPGLPGMLDGLFSGLSLVVGALVAAWVGWRRTAALAWLAAVVTLLALAPVLSPQYLAWFVPALAVAAPELGDRRVFVIVAAVLALTWLTAYVFFAALIAGAIPAELVMVARDVLLAVIAVSACAAGGRRRRPLSARRLAISPAE